MKELINTVHLLAVEELNKANKKFPQFHSRHEGIGVLDEEIWEMGKELRRFNKANIDLHEAVYNDFDCEKALRSAELSMSAALAEGVQVLAMLKKFRCFLDKEEKQNEKLD